jgi:hypothetical protein
MVRRALHPAVLAGVVAVLVILAGAYDSMRPYVTLERQVPVATPGLGALESRATVPLLPGDEVCIRPVIFDPKVRMAQVRIVAPKGPTGPPLRFTASGPGYRSTARVEGWEAPGDQVPEIPLTPPPRDVTGQACIRNEGRTRAELVGTDELRSIVFAETVRNGRVVEGIDLELSLLAPRARLIDRPGELVEKVSLMSGGIPTWLLWGLLVLVVAGIPTGAVAALVLSLRR